VLTTVVIVSDIVDTPPRIIRVLRGVILVGNLSRMDLKDRDLCRSRNW
jgi:hypothetical protein